MAAAALLLSRFDWLCLVLSCLALAPVSLFLLLAVSFGVAMAVTACTVVAVA